MSIGSVSPWKTSVPRMTQNVRNTIRSRCGNELPAFVVNGTASAAARDTAPRIPAQATTAERLTGGAGLFASNDPQEPLRQVREHGHEHEPRHHDGARDEHPPPDELRPRVAR